MRQKKAQKTLVHVQETYDQIGPQFSASRKNIRHDFEHYQNVFQEGQSIVDLGCGSGRLLLLLQEKLKTFDYVGVDNSDVLLDEARKNYPNKKFIHGDQLSLPLADKSCDVLCNIRAFHHLPSKDLQEQALLEMKRVLRPDGLLILTCWNLWNEKQRKHILYAAFRGILNLGQTGYKDTLIPWGEAKEMKRYYYAFTLPELKKLIERCGFMIIESKKAQDLILIARKTDRHKILGVPFDNMYKKDVIKKVIQKISLPQNKALFIATPNPEILLESQKNKIFFDVLNQTDLNVPDGFGVMLAARFIGMPLKERVTGVDLLQDICRQSPKGTRFFLLGAAPGVAELTKEKLKKTYPHIEIVGTYSGSPALSEEHHIRGLIDRSMADVLFVAYGAPKQELWLSRNLPLLKHVKIAMGVGGSFDFIAGTIARAPSWMRNLGLEWLFRLIKQPSRFGRIYNATVKFPIIFLISLFKKH